MQKTLMILEVSRKQDYIFAKKKLRENAARSGIISYVTGHDFFEKTAPEFYEQKKNLVYSGGGHTVLQFDSHDRARDFASRVTAAAMKQYRGLELFVKLMDYDNSLSPADNLIELSARLERKKSLRAHAFKRVSSGVETLDEMTHLPKTDGNDNLRNSDLLPAPEGWEYPAEFEELAGEDNFIAVVHADGNAMGNRVNAIYETASQNWEKVCSRLRRFSEGIQHDFETAFSQMTEEVLRHKELQPPCLPVRPIILAGDDVCFVTAGKLGLECARIFLEKLSNLKNEEDGQPYSACAGVALVHTKFPFHRAYDLAEELCSSAKKFGSGLDERRTISALDWHIEFGQLKDSLSQQREDYVTEDGKQLELRPVTVVVPEDVEKTEEMSYRSYDFFRVMCSAMQGEYGKTARGKIKELRTAMKQGRVETEYFLADKEVSDLLYHGFDARYNKKNERWAQYRKMIAGDAGMEKRAFVGLDKDRCLFFDAIEMIDHCEFLKEAEECVTV